MATVALTGTAVALSREPGADCVNDIDGGGGGDATIVVEAIAAFDGVVAAEEAVMETTAPDGTPAGAV